MRTRGKPFLATLVFSILMIGVLLIVSSQPARADSNDLPPRPTPEVTTKSTGGVYIRLNVAFPESWSWTARPWQSTLTQVQWQTGEGNWVNVDGWYGALDTVDINDDGSVTGTKVWWVAPRDYGAGPFRWQASAGDGKTSLAVSAPFTLPVRGATTLDIVLSLPE